MAITCWAIAASIRPDVPDRASGDDGPPRVFTSYMCSITSKILLQSQVNCFQCWILTALTTPFSNSSSTLVWLPMAQASRKPMMSPGALFSLATNFELKFPEMWGMPLPVRSSSRTIWETDGKEKKAWAASWLCTYSYADTQHSHHRQRSQEKALRPLSPYVDSTYSLESTL